MAKHKLTYFKELSRIILFSGIGRKGEPIERGVLSKYIRAAAPKR